MNRMFAAVLLLGVVSPVSVAGPPEQPSGRMALFQDDVAQAIGSYRRAKDEENRVELLRTLARTRDPRVAVTLGEALSDSSESVRAVAAHGIFDYQVDGYVFMRRADGKLAVSWASSWWMRNKDELCLQAKKMARKPLAHVIIH